MYTKFFKLSGKPFDVSPNPRFFYLNTPLKKVAADISKNFSEPMGVIVLTGGIGTGKTTFLNYLNQQFRLLFPSQPMFSTLEVFLSIKEALEIPLDSTEPIVLCNTTAKYLKDLPEKKQYDALAFDEAQGCSKEMLSGLGQLQEAVYKTGGKLPVLLCGHEELVSNISKLKFKPEMGNQLFFYEMKNFNFQDMQSMIDYRLKLAGSSILNIFSEEAIEAVYKMTHGVPRLVNNICDISLMTSFGKDQTIISSETVLEVAENAMNLQRQLHLLSKSEPLVEKIEPKKTMQPSRQPDLRISENNTPDKGLGKKKFPFRSVKIAASVLLVSLLVGLSGLFLYKRTLDKNDTEVFHPTQEHIESLFVIKDVPVGLGYTPASDLTPRHDNKDGGQTSLPFVLNDGKEAVPEGDFQINDGLLDEPAKGDMPFEMVLSDRQNSLPPEETDPGSIRALEDNTVKKEMSSDIALNNQYTQKRTIQARTAPEPTIPEKIIHEQTQSETAMPDLEIEEQIIQIMVAREQAMPEQSAPDETIQEQAAQDQVAQIKIVPEQTQSETAMPEETMPDLEIEEQIVQIKAAHEQKKALGPAKVSSAVKVLPELPAVKNNAANKPETDQSSKVSIPAKKVVTVKRPAKKTPDPGSKIIKQDTFKNQPKPQFSEALSEAIQNNDKALVTQLLTQGTDPDAIDEKGSSLLLKAAESGNLEIFNALLNKGADINAKDRYGDTLLMKASWAGTSHVVSLLLKHHADINRQNQDGSSALFYGAINGHEEIVKILLGHQADTELADINRKTPLMAAAWNGNIAIVNLLLEHNTGVDKKDKSNWTALMFAAFQGHKDIVKRLIAAGSNTSLKNSEGDTCVSLAARQGYNELFLPVPN